MDISTAPSPVEHGSLAEDNLIKPNYRQVIIPSMFQECYDLHPPYRVCLLLEGSIAFVDMDLLPLYAIFVVQITKGSLRNGFGWESQAKEGNPVLHGETSLLKKGLFA